MALGSAQGQGGQPFPENDDATTDVAAEAPRSPAERDASGRAGADSVTSGFAILSQPPAGSVSNNADGTFSFDPGADFRDLAVGQSRTVSFTFLLAGSELVSATVTVTGTSEGPIATDVHYTSLGAADAAQAAAGARVGRVASEPAAPEAAADPFFAADPARDLDELSFADQVDTPAADIPEPASESAAPTVDTWSANRDVAQPAAESSPWDDLFGSAETAPDPEEPETQPPSAAPSAALHDEPGPLAWDEIFDGGAEPREADPLARDETFDGGAEPGEANPPEPAREDEPWTAWKERRAAAEKSAAGDGLFAVPDSLDTAPDEPDPEPSFEPGSEPTFEPDPALSLGQGPMPSVEPERDATEPESSFGGSAVEPDAPEASDGYSEASPGEPSEANPWAGFSAAGTTSEAAPEAVSGWLDAADSAAPAEAAPAPATLRSHRETDFGWAGTGDAAPAVEAAPAAPEPGSAEAPAASGRIVSQPFAGRAIDNGDGTFDFDPADDFDDLGIGETRDVTFDVRLSNGDDYRATVTVVGDAAGPYASDVNFERLSPDGPEPSEPEPPQSVAPQPETSGETQGEDLTALAASDFAAFDRERGRSVEPEAPQPQAPDAWSDWPEFAAKAAPSTEPAHQPTAPSTPAATDWPAIGEARFSDVEESTLALEASENGPTAEEPAWDDGASDPLAAFRARPTVGFGPRVPADEESDDATAEEEPADAGFALFDRLAADGPAASALGFDDDEPPAVAAADASDDKDEEAEGTVRRDTLHLKGVRAGPGVGGWTLRLTNGKIAERQGSYVVLSPGAAGTLVLDDSAVEISFNGIERIDW